MYRILALEGSSFTSANAHASPGSKCGYTEIILVYEIYALRIQILTSDNRGLFPGIKITLESLDVNMTI